MSNAPSLDLILTFRGVMEHGSLSATARALRLSQPTVRRQIEALEAQTGAKLFTRASNGLTPTPMARSLLPLAQSVAHEAEAFARSAASQAQARAGTVRLTASRVLSTHCLPLVLPVLHDAFPDIRIELTATDRAENMARRAADVALRLTAPTQDALIARKLPAIAFGVFAAPHKADAFSAAGLRHAPMISDDRHRQIEPGLAALGHPVPENVVLRTDDPLAQIAAIQAGLGIGITQCAIAQRLGLVRLFPDIETTLPCYVVMHEDQAQIARVRAIFDGLVTHLPELI